MPEPIFKLFGNDAKKVIKAFKENKFLRYRVEHVEGRLVVKVFVE